MRLSRLFVSFQLEPGDAASLGPRQAHYVARVLRLRALDPVVLFNGDGFDYSAVITHVGRDEVRVQIETRLPLANESPLSVTLTPSARPSKTRNGPGPLTSMEPPGRTRLKYRRCSSPS